MQVRLLSHWEDGTLSEKGSPVSGVSKRCIVVLFSFSMKMFVDVIGGIDFITTSLLFFTTPHYLPFSPSNHPSSLPPSPPSPSHSPPSLHPPFPSPHPHPPPLPPISPFHFSHPPHPPHPHPPLPLQLSLKNKVGWMNDKRVICSFRRYHKVPGRQCYRFIFLLLLLFFNIIIFVF